MLDLLFPRAEALDPLFWPPSRLGVDSAWYGHVPFAHWLVCNIKPRVLVELGTQHGVSYAAFCEAVARLRLPTACYAVDTWTGDEHAGFYGDEVYQDLVHFNSARYASFSELLRSTFEEAAVYFADNSIDLLHIDGFHTYEAVKHDFESWLPKLSERAVVLFHDTNVRERSFGAWRLFLELRQRWPAFEFLHGHGLGVVAVGTDVPAAVAALCSLDQDSINSVRDRFAVTGEHWAHKAIGGRVQVKVQRQLEEHAQVIEAFNATLNEVRTRADALEADLQSLRAELQSLRAELQSLRAELHSITNALGPRLEKLSRRIISWKSYDDAYKIWKKYKKNNISRDTAINAIENEYSVSFFILFYPLYKTVRPFVKLYRKIIG